MTSPHRTIADGIKSVAAAWAATDWTDALCVVGFHIERFKQIVEDDQKIVIGVMPTSVEDQDSRAARQHDEDAITVSVFVMARLDDLDDATVLTHDDKTAALYLHLKQLHEITVGSQIAERETTKYFTVFDHDALTSEIWASLILCEYSLDSGPLGTVTVPA